MAPARKRSVMSQSQRKFRGGSALLAVVLGTLSLATFGLGLRLPWNDRTPVALEKFPTESALFLASDKATLVLVATENAAKCQAQIEELAQVVKDSQAEM